MSLRRLGLWTLAAMCVASAATQASAGCTDLLSQFQCSSGGELFAYECNTTSISSCNPDGPVLVQLGGQAASDSGDHMPWATLSDGTWVTALVCFERDEADPQKLRVTIDNCTPTIQEGLPATSTLSAVYFMAGTSISGMSLSGILPNPDLTWSAYHELACQKSPSADEQDPSRPDCSPPGNTNGFHADGFGRFDAVISNSTNLSPGGGNAGEIEPDDGPYTFTLDVTSSTNDGSDWSVCDILSELSETPPGSRLVNLIGRYQAGTNGGSNFIGPCGPYTTLLAVLSRFDLSPDDNHVLVKWDTSIEIDNAGFNVLRREAKRGGWERINVELIPGQGDTVTGARYQLVDHTALNGVEYVYRIEDIDFRGKNDFSDIRSAVVNPRNPKLRLQNPAYGAEVSLSGRPTFSYNGMPPGGLLLQVSSDPSFEAETSFSTHVPRRFGSADFSPNRRTTRRMERMAVASDGILYWRLVDRDLNPVSDTFRLEVIR